MAENSLVLEKERLAQELSIGYKYFGNLKKVKGIRKKLSKQYADIQDRVEEKKYPQKKTLKDTIKSVSNSTRLNLVEEQRKEQVADIKKNPVLSSYDFWHSVLTWFRLTLVLGFLLALLILFLVARFNRNADLNVWGSVLVVSGLIMSIIGIIWAKNSFDDIEDQFESLFVLFVNIAAQKRKIKEAKNASYESLQKEVFKLPEDELAEKLKKFDPEVYQQSMDIYNRHCEEYDQSVKNLDLWKKDQFSIVKKKIKDVDKTLNQMQNNVAKEIRNYLTVIPLDYFNEEAITGMLYYYTNKRGDTIKELINLYENEKFKEKLLGSIQQNTRTMQSIGKVVVTQLQTISNKMNSLQMELKAMQNSLEEVSRSNLANAYSVLSVMQKQLETQQEQYRQYEETVKINSQLDSVYKNLTVAIDGEPVDVKIYG